tara:strand:+ start:287 stop:484 length:198 start_codon:yes stop_codon:yes gene_type:complete
VRFDAPFGFKQSNDGEFVEMLISAVVDIVFVDVDVVVDATAPPIDITVAVVPVVVNVTVQIETDC